MVTENSATLPTNNIPQTSKNSQEKNSDRDPTFISDRKLLRLAEKDMSLFEKTKKYISELFDRVAGLKKEYNAFRPDSIESEIVNGMTDTIKQLHKLWEDAAIAALENSREAATAQKENGLPRGEATRNDNSKNNSGTKQKNTTSEGDVKMQARELQRKDPTKLKEEELNSLLEFTKDKMLSDDTYIPVRINTPQILIAFAKELGYTLENHPLAMQVYKARQALSNEENWDGDYKDKPHDLSPEELIVIIRAMNNPSHLIFQTENERFAEIVKFKKEGSKEKAYAIVDFSDVNKNPDLMNGYKGGKYNILVTVYPSEDSADLKKYLSNKNHKVLTGEQMKKKSISQGSYGGNTPSLLNDLPFFEISISQTSKNSQEKNLDRDPAFISDRKQRQFEIIQKTNPMWDSYHTGIRTVADIRTWDEVLKLDDEREGQFVWGDYSRADAERALTDGEITVYSSYPIKNGVFVSTSHIQAQEYAGGKNAKVYSKTVPLTDVAWINGDEGQYAKVPESEISQSKGDVKMSIREEFYDEFDKWVADGKKDTNIRFVVGTTSDVLKSIGMKDHEIILPSGTINQKLNKHRELTTDIFRNIPDLLEHPVIIQFSDAIDPKTHKPKYDSRITLLGELYADMFINGKTIKKPVLVSMELLPTNQKKTMVLDFSVITSVYGHSKLQQYLNDNSILYIDPNKKRTNKWLSLNRLQLPLGETKYGSVRKITYLGDKVKIQNSNNKTALEIALEKAGVVDEFGNTKNSDRDPAFISDRKLLADALLSTAQNDGEYKMLTDYKKQIKKMYVEQQTLDDLNRQIKEISFKKGKKDYERLRTLRDEAIKTANRINLYDKRLLRIEAAAPLRAVLRLEKAKAVSEQKKADAQQLKQYFTTRKGGFS